MCTTRILILGLVRWLQPVHGYDVRRELLSWGVDESAQIKPGSIYHGLKKLAADDLLEVASTGQVDNRPARTSYRVTAAGEEEFQSLLREKLWNLDRSFDPFSVAWSFAPVLSAREAAAMLRNRAKMLRDKAEQDAHMLKTRSDRLDSVDYLPPHVDSWLRLQVQVTRLHVDWCEQTALAAEAGKLAFGDELRLDANSIKRWKEHIQTLGPDGTPGHAP